MRKVDQFTLEPRNPAQFVEVVRARAPRGFSDAIREAAETRRISPSEFIRRALAEKLAGDIGERTINV